MHKMSKKDEKIALYRRFFKISKVTNFSKNSNPKVTKTPLAPPQFDPCSIPIKGALLYQHF